LTNTSVWPWQTLVTSHGIKAMLKYMHLLSQSSIACDKFARASRGVKVIRELMDESGYRKDCMDVARKMLEGARPSSRTEMVMQLEEAGIIPAIFEHLKDKKEPVPMKVAAVELIKAMQADEDEATSDAVKTAVDRYPEVRAAPLAGSGCELRRKLTPPCAQWAEFRDAKHDLFVQTGGDVLLLEGGSMDTLLLTDSPGGYGGAAEEEDEAM